MILELLSAAGSIASIAGLVKLNAISIKLNKRQYKPVNVETW